jgi:hypothetical protein
MRGAAIAAPLFIFHSLKMKIALQSSAPVSDTARVESRITNSGLIF